MAAKGTVYLFSKNSFGITRHAVFVDNHFIGYNHIVAITYDDDGDKKALLNYKYMQLPAKLGGLVVKGSTKQTKLSWQGVPGSYISRYKVYASREKGGPLKYLTDVAKTEAVIKHNSAFTNSYYSRTF